MEKKYEIEYLDIEENKEYENILKPVIEKCFETERLDKLNLYISVILTNPSNIKKINSEYRNIDKETDVLSFPMFEPEELEKLKIGSNNANIEIDKETELNKADNQIQSNDEVLITPEEVLGDVIISIERVKLQAEEYGHSFERELAYMLVHGFYHLCGYDHMKEDEKIQMRKKEENILEKLNINR